jgi:pseudoazurin
MRLSNVALAVAVGWSLAMALPASAADHQIKMLNKGADGQTMVFEPAFVKIAPGDTVTFVPTDKMHNSESINGMTPDGAQPWKGKVSEQTTVSFTAEGLYGYKCLPHYAMGMVGVIQVGDSTANLDAFKAVKNAPFAQKRIDAALAAGGIQ